MMNRGDIYWCNLIGVESVQGGKRPCLIISNNLNNQHSPTINIIPMTSKNKNNLPVHYKFKINGIVNTLLVEQITTIPKSFVENYIGTMSKESLSKIQTCLIIQLLQDTTSKVAEPEHCCV